MTLHRVNVSARENGYFGDGAIELHCSFCGWSVEFEFDTYTPVPFAKLTDAVKTHLEGVEE